ncbi:hypothetical protein Tco_0894382 [Tanacetum coccineum]|uniref:Secreted protein n=1 Tax=Tanacetum coccineum TaxID=301880 RepID=A0ABQ5CBI5_9ASTR
MLQVLVVDQASVLFIHRMSLVSVLAPMETMCHLMCRYCSFPPMQNAAPYLMCRALLLTSCAERCFLHLVQSAAPYLLYRRRSSPFVHARLLTSCGDTALYLLRRHCSSS